MSTTIPTLQVEPELAIGLGAELRIRLADTVEEMRARFDEFVAQNPELNVEQDPSGEIVIMSPTGAEGSSSNGEIARQLGNWGIATDGRTFDGLKQTDLVRCKRRCETTSITACGSVG